MNPIFIEEHIEIAVPPERVFQLYADVAHWNVWDPDTAASWIDGEFQRGSRGRLRPTKGREVPMEVISVQENASFTVESRLPFFRMRFDHELTETENGVIALHRVTLDGLLTPILGRIVAKQVCHDLPITMQSLKKTAEAQEHS